MEALTAEHAVAGAPLGVTRPRLSWRIAAGPRDWLQAGYDLRLERAGGDVSEHTAYGRESVLQRWPFADLAPRERASVRVRVRGEDGSASPWSAPLELEVGLLGPADWSARFVGPELDRGFLGALHLRRPFTLAGPAVRARLHVTALGVFEPYLNGTRVGDHVLDPGWTSYPHRICYSTFDVTDLLRAGENVLGVLVADGWYRGRLGFNGGRRAIYGDRLGVLAQLEMEQEDGTTQVVASDGTWRSSPGPIVEASLYDGESYDARLELGGWSSPGYDASGWAPVAELPDVPARVEPSPRPPARVTEALQPVEVVRDGEVVRLDFGQNLVGWLRLTARGAAGDQLVLRHAEVLEDGGLCLRPLRTARATDTYVLRGGGPETWEPRFTFHGFRYAEITGAVDALDLDRIEAVVVHSDLERTGWFGCSHPGLERLHENVVWSMRGNFLTLPTDCPQRDERVGWTGDIQVFAPTACFLYDTRGFLASWLADLAAEQTADGGVPNIVPDPQAEGSLPDDHPTAVWGDAAVLVPWTLYQRYGDRGLLETQYPSMRGWVDYVATRLSADGIWESDWQYGDWLDPAASPHRPWEGLTDPALVATAYAAHTAAVLARIAGILGEEGDAARFAAHAGRLRHGFAGRFVLPDGAMRSDSQTAYALALAFDLVEDGSWRRAAAARLAELVEAGGFRIGTGFAGTAVICDALTATGHEATAFRLVLEEECPSWLYPVSMGATTIWERWDSLLPDGSVNPGQMTSFNHYAFGAIADWLHRVAAGLAPAAPGYRRLDIRPRPADGLRSASARLQTPYGLAASSWTLDDGTFALDVVVPPNTTADVRLPDGRAIGVGSGRHVFTCRVPAATRVTAAPGTP